MYGLRIVQVVLLLLSCLTATQRTAWAQFEARSTTPVDNAPWSLATGDFNHDGQMDVAVAVDTGIAILLGKGNGTFRPAVVYPDAAVPSWVVVADLNHDGNLDVVVANQESSVSVLLGNGDGSFQPAKTFNISAMPNALAVGDFNGDKKPDLAIADPPYISILLGNGDGTFQVPIDNASLPTYVPALAIGDFNGDGKLDVAAAAPNSGFVSIGILLGNGDGTLQSVVNHPVNFQPQSLVAADFNGDGTLDLAYGYLGLGVLLGDGNGNFQSELDYPGGGEQMATGDFNGDGKVDIAMADFPELGVSVFLGNGDGTFQLPTVYPVGSEPAFLATADFNDDHELDLVVTDRLYNHVNVLLNTGVVSFSTVSPLMFPTQLVNTIGVPQAVTLTNSGAIPLSISSITVKGEFQLNNGTTCGTSLSAGANCAVNVTFGPQTMGAKNGIISIADSASSKPQVIELTGSGTVVSLSPSKLSFPRTKVGTRRTPLAVTVTNQGSTVLSISTVSIAGGKESRDFSETDNCTSQQISPGASCTVNMTFAPSKTGPRVATLVVSDNGGGNWQTVPLSGSGF
jgi:archaellum component FlaF (FlaF/FlaG flagellin family)